MHSHGHTNAWVMPTVGTEPMQAHLNDLSRQVGRRTHALLVLDRAGWHTTARLTIPANITLLALPARSPELNPAEMLWRELRQRYPQATASTAAPRRWSEL